MRDGLLVKVINFDENLKRFVSLRTTAKFFHDFTDFCEVINETCEEHNLTVEIQKGTDGGKGYYIDSVDFYFFDSENDLIGSMSVMVIVNAETCLNEFKNKIK